MVGGAVSASEDERGSVYDPFPDLLAHSDEGPSRPQQTQQGQLSDACELLGAELLTRSVLDPRGPPIEKASDGNERSRCAAPACATASPGPPPPPPILCALPGSLVLAREGAPRC